MAISGRRAENHSTCCNFIPVPGRVPDHGIEAATQLGLLPVRPNAGERDLPIQETFGLDEFPSPPEKAGETHRHFRFCQNRGATLSNVDRIAERPIQPGEVCGPVLAVAKVHPVEGVKKRQQRIQRRRHFQDLGKLLGGAMRLRNLRVRQSLDGLHGCRRVGGPVERVLQEQAALLFGLVDGGPHPDAEQAVATAQMMVQEAERRAHREGVQPQRDLGQLHRHRVLVHAVDAALEHHATNDVPVVKLVRVHCPAAPLGIGQNSVPDRVDSLGQRRDVVAPRLRRVHLGLGDGADHLVGHQVHEADQEVPGPHGRVADLQVEECGRRIECPDLQEPVMFRQAAVGQLVDPASEGLLAGLD